MTKLRLVNLQKLVEVLLLVCVVSSSVRAGTSTQHEPAPAANQHQHSRGETAGSRVDHLSAPAQQRHLDGREVNYDSSNFLVPTALSSPVQDVFPFADSGVADLDRELSRSSEKISLSTALQQKQTDEADVAEKSYHHHHHHKAKTYKSDHNKEYQWRPLTYHSGHSVYSTPGSYSYYPYSHHSPLSHHHLYRPHYDFHPHYPHALPLSPPYALPYYSPPSVYFRTGYPASLSPYRVYGYSVQEQRHGPNHHVHGSHHHVHSALYVPKHHHHTVKNSHHNHHSSYQHYSAQSRKEQNLRQMPETPIYRS